MEKTQEYFFSSRTKGIYYQVELLTRPVIRRHHFPHLPSEGQRCHVQPVALICNFSYCRFLSKGQSETVHKPQKVGINEGGDRVRSKGLKYKNERGQEWQ